MKRNRILIFVFLSIIPGFVSFGKINPVKLTCEYLLNPSVVDVARPRLAWINIASEGELGQSLIVLWDKTRF